MKKTIHGREYTFAHKWYFMRTAPNGRPIYWPAHLVERIHPAETYWKAMFPNGR